ncbi:hypothetical protein GPUN_2114 [Glaciecola punicea ACAM 611]|uniref:Uncharacterized protein n=1 Tax=Glaciecola punicea ACAM 611 TaxID=1121923 RepID=H5TD52_9ALTE|nr:hypothetical protein GPUN_2114 [Glaciecola punicea ACAM 611]
MYPIAIANDISKKKQNAKINVLKVTLSCCLRQIVNHPSVSTTAKEFTDTLAHAI